MLKSTSKSNFFILLVIVLIGMVATFILLASGYRFVQYNADIKVQEVLSASNQFNKMIADVVEDELMVEVDASNLVIDEEKWMPLEDFLTLTGDTINENNCFIHNEFSVQVSSDFVIEKNSVQYVNFDAICKGLGYGYKKTNSGYTLYREFATKRLIVDEVNDVKFTYNAIDKVKADDYVFLQYASEKEAMIAYENLSVTYNVDIDKKYKMYYSVNDENQNVFFNANSTNEYGENFYSWGGDVMGFNEYNEYLKQVCGNNLNEVIAAVIDTGINYNHPLFENRIHPYSYSFSHNQLPGQIMDEEGHGSHVAGTIAELTNSNVKILALKTVNSEGFHYQGSVQLAYSYILSLLDKGLSIKVVNASYGADENEIQHTLAKVIYGTERKIKQIIEKGVVFCAAAGNDSKDASNHYPASIDGVVCVGAIDKDGQLAEFSNYGEEVDLVAPGVEIYGAHHLSNGFVSYQGTSMACPHISASVAMIFSDSKANYKAEDVKRLLTTTCAIDLGEEGDDDVFGSGYPDLRKLIKPLSFDTREEITVTNYTIKTKKALINNNDNLSSDALIVPKISISYVGEDSLLKSIQAPSDFSVTDSYSVSTINGINLYTKNSNGYKFLGWKISQSEILTQDIYYSKEATCTVKNLPDGAIIYVLAVYDYETVNLDLVFNFKNVDEFDGYMGYGVNVIVELFVNEENIYQEFDFSTTPRKMAFRIENVIPLFADISLSVEDGGIGAILSQDSTSQGFIMHGQNVSDLFFEAQLKYSSDGKFTIVFEILV